MITTVRPLLRRSAGHSWSSVRPRWTSGRWWADRPWLGDTALATILAASFAVFQAEQEPATPWIVATIALQTLPLMWRRRAPWLVLVAVTAGVALYRVPDPVLSFGPIFQAICVYTVGRHSRQPWSRAAPVLATAGLLIPEYVFTGAESVMSTSLGMIVIDTVLVLAMFGALWMLGSGQRRIRADAARLRLLADRLRAEQELSAQRAVAAERARIARDLHDIVAHHVSAIAVQARATEEIVAEDAELAGAGIQRIGATADAALHEMRRLVTLLTTEADPADPEPSLAHLGRLVHAVETAGCCVELRADESASRAPQAVQVSAYRIIQEALTNVLKHAGATDVTIDVRRGPSELLVDVWNGAPGPGHRPVVGSALGLVGMGERVAIFGGMLRVGPLPGGGWSVHATLPFEESR